MKPPLGTAHSLLLSLALVVFGLAWVAPTLGQEPTPDEGPGGLSTIDEKRLQILSDPDALKKKEGKDKVRLPYEFFRSQVAPNDVLPWVKANHWNSLTVELRANDDDFEGALQSLPVPLTGMPQEMIYAREARLVKEQRSRLGMQILLPALTRNKEQAIELIRSGAIRADQVYLASLRALTPQQMLVMVLSKESNGVYAGWSRLSAMIPSSLDRGDSQALDTLRYYRLVLPLEPDKPLLSPHPLTWTALSHVVWDGMEPDVLSVSQQSAFLDWLHWGGQLVVIGGAGPQYSILRESFLEPYLPADPSGENQLCEEADLRALSVSYRPPPRLPSSVDPPSTAPVMHASLNLSYGAPDPIRPAADKPLYLAGLRPREGAVSIPLGVGSPRLLAVESRVGRGRITMLTINPNDPALVAWKGLDTLVRRVVLRRAEESSVPLGRVSDMGASVYLTQSMEGPDLSWYRIAARDLGGVRPPPPSGSDFRQMSPRSYVQSGGVKGIDFSSTYEAVPELMGVAEWRDETGAPRLCRELLERASGITVPSSQFVLKVILAYVLAVVPLNWLICHVLLRRKEAAWVMVPLLALGFAVGVERVAAYDLGFDSACDEIDLLEIQGDFPRGHLSRFASIYSTGRGRYRISFPNDPTALALPLASGRSIAGEDLTTSVWRSYPVPALEDFSVQPRSLAMFRAEQMLSLPGPIAMEADGGRRMVRNDSGLELRDATLIEFGGPGERREVYLGTIAPGASVDLDPTAPALAPDQIQGFDGPDPGDLVAELCENWENRPENHGEIRLVAWSPKPIAGPNFEPVLDRHRGVTVVLAHLRYGEPPSPAARHYDLLATDETTP